MRLGDLAESIDYGVTASASDQPVGPKFLRITDIQDGRVDWRGVPWCDCDSNSAAEAQLQPGDIVFARTGATTGKSFLIRDCPTDAVFASYLIRVRVGDSADPLFVSHFFKTPNYWAQIAKGARGAAQPGVNATTLKGLRIPLPSLPEQRRIANILDRADALRAKRHAALGNLDTLTQSIFLDMFGDPARNTKELPERSLGELGEWQSGGTPPRGKKDYFGGTIPWFTSGELEEMYLSQSSEALTEQALRETSAKAVPRGSLLLGMYDTAALKASFAGTDCSCNQAIAFATIRQDLADPVFVYFAIRIGREHFRRQQRGVRQKNLNLTMIREIRIPFPTITLQRQFADRVAEIGRLRDLHSAAHTDLNGLFASLQHRAFRGEL
jgi:type I restriction enzyme S subunit